MNYKNQLILTGKLNDVGAYIRENVDQSYRAGVEVEVKYDMLKNLSIQLSNISNLLNQDQKNIEKENQEKLNIENKTPKKYLHNYCLGNIETIFKECKISPIILTFELTGFYGAQRSKNPVQRLVSPFFDPPPTARARMAEAVSSSILLFIPILLKIFSLFKYLFENFIFWNRRIAIICKS
jgi:hypothetical protein